MRDAALELAQAGWFVFPVQERGKQPLVKWREKSTVDPTQVTAWWDQWPDANIGIDCGKSGLAVIDYDGVEPPEVDTLTVRTGRGVHHYFSDGGRPVQNSASLLGDKIDVRGEGGYVLAPPSVHPSGAIYAWEGSDIALLPDEYRQRMVKEKAEAPVFVVDEAPRVSEQWGEKILRSEAAIVRTTGSGRRNAQLFDSALRVMSAVKGGHLDRELAFSELLQAAQDCGLERHESEQTVQSAWERCTVRNPPERYQSFNRPADEPAEGWDSMDVETLVNLPPPRWLVPNLVVDGMNWLIGEQKIGKTFLALDAAMTLAQTQPVAYFAGEGVSGLGVRIQAWMERHRLGPGNMHVFPFVPRLSRPGDPQQLVATVEKLQPALVVIDTFARAMGGADENSALEVGKFIDMCDEARQRTGCGTLILHHPAKNGTGYRGSGAIAGAADLLCVLTEDQSVPGSLTLTYDDVKDFEPPHPRHFQLRRQGESAVIHPSARESW
jgi:hypothetical protein